MLPLPVGVNIIEPSTSTRVLGLQLSSDMTMDPQIYAIARAANFNLYRLGKIIGHLTTDATKIIVHSLLITHLNYANPLLADLPKKKTKTTPVNTGVSCASHFPWRNIHNGIKIPTVGQNLLA
jgi:hypothetical protein